MGFKNEHDVRRVVRMVLMEWLPSRTMLSVVMSPKFLHMPPQLRLDILGKAMEAFCHVGIS